MSKQDKDWIEVDRKKETRSKGISKMISEGGLGADKYYNIKKDRSTTENGTKAKKDKE